MFKLFFSFLPIEIISFYVYMASYRMGPQNARIKPQLQMGHPPLPPPRAEILKTQDLKQEPNSTDVAKP